MSSSSKRPSSNRSYSASSRSSGEPSTKLARHSSDLHDVIHTRKPLRVHILQAKLAPHELTALYRLIEGGGSHLVKSETANHGQGGPLSELVLEHTADVQQADVVVTAVRMKQRLERHLEWPLAKTKAIVTPQWLEDSCKLGRPMPCGDYAALQDFCNEIVQKCSDKSTRASTSRVSHEARSRSPSTLGSLSSLSSISSSLRCSSVSSKQSKPNDTAPEYAQDAEETDVILSHTSRYCCARVSPLICPNQGLVRQLDIVRQARGLEGEERSMLSYARAISTIKAYPWVITTRKFRTDVARLPFLGEKISYMVEEYLQTGKITEAQDILASERFQCLSLFTTVHGIGSHTARRLYDLGLRSFRDLEKYYDVVPHATDSETLDFAQAADLSEESLVEKSIRVALALRHELSTGIPRDETEEINRLVMCELNEIEKGYLSMVVGGYRRGKPESNDVDIVITHSDVDRGAEKVKGLSQRLVKRLHERGLVTHVLHLAGFHEHNALRTHHWDSLEKALTVFVLPPSPNRRTLHRRLDLIFAVPNVFWTAVVGWTGSTMFQRDLRLWAKEKGMKFDSSGISRRHDSKLFFPMTEREVFDTLGLVYIHPTLRNADA